MSTHIRNQPSLFYLRVGTVYPALVNGADICFQCEAKEGGTYYCKSDKDNRSVRAKEWFLTRFASELGIATAQCAIMESANAGETFFGSLSHVSTANTFELRDFLSNSQKGELGQHSEWPGMYLSQLYVFDLFIHNVDRSLQNFVLQLDGSTRKLCAIDFASSDLDKLTGHNFPVATDPTVWVGRYLRERHGFFPKSAFEMIDKIQSIPEEILLRILKEMPDDWMSAERKEGICAIWSKGLFKGRLMALRSGLADGTLL